jgi:hypothetical protein
LNPAEEERRVKWSAIVVLNASGADLDVDRFVAQHGLEVANVWRRGEANRRGVHQNSGFTLDVGEASSPADLLNGIEGFLEESASLRRALVDAGSDVWLSIGLMVYAMSPRTFSLPPALIQTLGAAGITLSVTGYPCSDDDDDGRMPSNSGGERG